MTTRDEYGIFFGHDPRNGETGGKHVVTLADLAEVGEWLAKVSEEERSRYVVRQRTVTVTPWAELHAVAPRPIVDPDERAEFLFGKN